MESSEHSGFRSILNQRSLGLLREQAIQARCVVEIASPLAPLCF